MVESSGLKRKLKAVPLAIIDALRAQMAIYADQVVAEMKSLVPVDTGALRDSIGWTWGQPPKGSLSIITVRGRSIAGVYLTVYVGTRDKTLGDGDAFYARWQEFGTKKMPASPFFYVSWRRHRRRVRSGINRTIKRAVQALN